jgi:3,4-dihydroxy-9,10-secoandrosta-1,3,5(10)-triene-9,17-dione 4,5-dioxygenase
MGTTYHLCQAQEMPILMKLGKHTNDHMVSFYLRTPFGFKVEYGRGAREVNDATRQVQVHHTGSIWGHQGSS